MMMADLDPTRHNMDMDPRLRGFLTRLVHSALNAGVYSLFWRLSGLAIFLLIVVLIAVVIWFQLY